ncbi:NUDIX hydrolase [Aurantiacibacter gangjinensis]|uniref:GDP-mannose pyrophosphatase n=1 Tax=Aurantiacibacter gangjinensis TaxID=502682 RepID=A0A0G9MVL9_9SPHN|nr:NUDIX hydrolase [Aurantiacibacter gangjinensis]APE26853.1 ADP-ribose pyrophosphatase [Aurantiacibacter gangjinensis]KLE33328.1 NUDIX hydrolase [Aurantiacibacter gangjinensis]
MSEPEDLPPEKTLWKGKWIEARSRGRWEYAARTDAIRAAVILAIEDGHVLLVEQFRYALCRRTLELPAGLIGDDDGADDDSALDAAKRELEEETGYRAHHWEEVGEFFSSPGMTSEGFTLLKATGLTKVSDGGGVEGENITVHRVPLAGFAATVADFRARGLVMDTRMLLMLGPQLLSDD